MRQITYRPLSVLGHFELAPIDASLADFIQDIPYFLSFNLIPPLSVMNEKFSSGEDDAGMSGGCVWEPFTLTQSEYEELVRELQERGLKYVAPPEWVRDKTDWHVWVFEFEFGAPWEEHYRLLREDSKWAKMAQEARKEDDQAKFLKYYAKSMRAGGRLARFLAPYIRRYRKKKDQQQ